MNKPSLDKEQINSFKNGDINDIAYWQALIDYFVNAVYVFDDHIKVLYNYENGTDTITLTEIEEAFSGSDLNSLLHQVISRSFRCSSFSRQTRFAGLCRE